MREGSVFGQSKELLFLDDPEGTLLCFVELLMMSLLQFDHIFWNNPITLPSLLMLLSLLESPLGLNESIVFQVTAQLQFFYSSRNPHFESPLSLMKRNTQLYTFDIFSYFLQILSNTL